MVLPSKFTGSTLELKRTHWTRSSHYRIDLVRLNLEESEQSGMVKLSPFGDFIS